MICKFGLFVTICVTISAAQNLIPQDQKCAKNGEYCQNHWDCCSNSCLSYLYKCVKSYNQPLPGEAPIVLTLNVRQDVPGDSMTLQQLIDRLFGPTIRPQGALATRFDTADMNTQAPFEGVISNCKTVGSKCFQNNECCTNVCHGFLHQCVT